MWESQSLYMFGHHIHMLFMLMILLGLILFIRWAWNQKPKVLADWSKKLLIIGVLGALLTGVFGWNMMVGGHKKMSGEKNMKMMESGKMMMDSDDMMIN